MLLAKPQIFQDECLVSYLIKISDFNGFNDVGKLLKYAGFAWKNNRIPVNHILTGEINLGGYFSNLKLVAYESSLGPIYDSFRTSIDTRFLLAKYPKVCPECIDEIGYCKYHWCILPMLACTRHNKMLIDSDEATGDRLSWYRKHLNRFDGADYNIKYAPSIAQPASIELSIFVESLIFQKPIPVTTPAILHGLGLREALSLIHFIAHYKAKVSGTKFQPTTITNSNLAQHYVSVWSDLKSWPYSFHSLLNEYVDSPMSTIGVSGVNKHYRDLYRRLHNQQRNMGIGRLKNEFDQYIEKSWPGSLATNRFTRIQLTSNRNVISKKETARILGCDLERVSRLVKQESLVPITFNGKAHYQKEQVVKLANLYTSNWTMAEACEELQLNRQQLKILLDNKIFNVLQKPNSLNRDWVIDKKHCRLVIASLKSKASSTKCSPRSYTLRGVLRRGYSISELVRAMQNGTVVYNLNTDRNQPNSFKQFLNYRKRSLL